MRLSKQEVAEIKSILNKFDDQAQIYLYGSRIDDSLKGGDIDLLIESKKLQWEDRFDILVDLKNALGDQRIDLSIKTPEEVLQDPFFSVEKKKKL